MFTRASSTERVASQHFSSSADQEKPLSTALAKFCGADLFVTPSLVEGSRLALSGREEGECRDSSTPLRGVYPIARCRAQNDVMQFLVDSVFGKHITKRSTLSSSVSFTFERLSHV